MDQLTQIQNTTASINTEEGAEVAVSLLKSKSLSASKMM